MLNAPSALCYYLSRPKDGEREKKKSHIRDKEVDMFRHFTKEKAKEGWVEDRWMIPMWEFTAIE